MNYIRWFRLDIREIFFTEGLVQALKQATEGSGITTPGSVGKPCGCGTWGFGFSGGHSGAVIRDGLNDLRGLSQP